MVRAVATLRREEALASSEILTQIFKIVFQNGITGLQISDFKESLVFYMPQILNLLFSSNRRQQKNGSAAMLLCEKTNENLVRK